MSDYKTLLWDIDGTVMDFLAAEKTAIKTLFKEFHLGECTDEMIVRYSVINRGYWERLERNEMSKDRILVERFKEFFDSEQIHTDCAEAFNKAYQLEIGKTVVFMEDANELLKELSTKYTQVAVTNGTRLAQRMKLAASGLDRIFDAIFISEEIGVEKPNKAFFDRIFDTLHIGDLSEVLIIGDSLTSDIRGGNNAGIDTCWYNPKHIRNTKAVTVKYEIDHLRQINEILLNGVEQKKEEQRW